MSVGRTSWWPCDSAEHDRELNVELGEEFGPGGPYLLRVMKDLAQQQRNDGSVRTGFKSLARKAFITASDARAIVERAASIGALDDLVIDDDGRRFVCRVSGWASDQARGRAAIKKADQRASTTHDVPPDGDVSAPEGDMSPVVTPTRDNQREEEQQPSVAASPDEEPVDVDPEVGRLSRLLADLIVDRDPKARARVKPDGKRWLTAMRLLIADRQGDTAEVERVLRWSQADSFWQANILSPTKLREQFVQLAQKSRAAGGGAHLRAVPADLEGCPETASSDAVTAWERVSARLQESVDQSTFDIWLRPLHPHRLERDGDRAVLVLGAPSTHAAWVRDRFARVLADAAPTGEIRIVTCSDWREEAAA